MESFLEELCFFIFIYNPLFLQQFVRTQASSRWYCSYRRSKGSSEFASSLAVNPWTELEVITPLDLERSSLLKEKCSYSYRGATKTSGESKGVTSCCLTERQWERRLTARDQWYVAQQLLANNFHS